MNVKVRWFLHVMEDVSQGSFLKIKFCHEHTVSFSLSLQVFPPNKLLCEYSIGCRRTSKQPRVCSVYCLWHCRNCIKYLPLLFLGLLVAQTVKSPPAMWETQVWFLGWDEPLEKEVETYSSILAWKNPTDGEAWQAIVHGAAKSRTWLNDFTFFLVFLASIGSLLWSSS